ncbi:MAG: shikimate dehydrogenase [Enterobacteriaceae bacterium]
MKYVLFGNPINHSKSSKIYEILSKINNVKHFHSNLEVPINKFEIKIKNFFNKGGCGANITSPFKKKAFYICKFLSYRSNFTKTVNFMKKVGNFIYGDNTDILGIKYDMYRLNFLDKLDNILIIGSGSVVESIMPFFIKNVKNITITNRTISKSYKIKNIYKKIKKINVIPLNKMKEFKYNLIVHATSCRSNNKNLNFKNLQIDHNVKCYDLLYKKGNTEFIDLCIKKGCKKYSNGLGMLLFQSIFNFYFWHNIKPNNYNYLIKLLNYIKNDLKKNNLI